MALITSFPGDYPFYGGLSKTWGTGLHVDMDSVTGRVEYLEADMLNRVEHRIQVMEYIVNQIEHELMYDSGTIATSGYTLSVPASGEYYISSRIDRMASGFNRTIEHLIASGVIESGSVPYYPIYVGTV